MALDQYLQLDEVRAALGMNDEELTDGTLSLPIYEIGLVRELAGIAAGLPAAYLTLAALTPGTLTSSQQTLVDAVHLFSVYAVARQVGPSLGLLAAKSISDGEATVVRFADSPYRDMLGRIESQYAGMRAGLLAAYALFTTSVLPAAVKPFIGFIAVGRGIDPVTGV